MGAWSTHLWRGNWKLLRLPERHSFGDAQPEVFVAMILLAHVVRQWDGAGDLGEHPSKVVGAGELG